MEQDPPHSQTIYPSDSHESHRRVPELPDIALQAHRRGVAQQAAAPREQRLGSRLKATVFPDGKMEMDPLQASRLDVVREVGTLPLPMSVASTRG